MAQSIGVRIDGELVSPASSPAAATGAVGLPGLRRRLLMGLVLALVFAVGLAAAVDRLRVHEVAGTGRAGLITAVQPCPPDRVCAIARQPSAQMWEATYRAFPDYEQVSTTVVFDASTGLSYSESILLGYGDVVIWLAVTREPGSVPRPMAIRVTASSDGVLVTAAPVDGPADRTVTVALSGTVDSVLPVDAAIGWVSEGDLFGDRPR